jgi:hypothetical protein
MTALVLLGWKKGWLTCYEVLLGIGLLLIPYVTRAYEISMASSGRFAAVVVPGFLVLGQLLHSDKSGRWAILLYVSAFAMTVYASLFAANYLVF